VRLGVYAWLRGSSVRHCCYLFNDVGHNGVTEVCLRFWLRRIYVILVGPQLLRVSLGSLQQRIICTFADVLSATNLYSVFVSSCSPCYRLHCQSKGALPLVCRLTFVATRDIWLLFTSCLLFRPRPPRSLPCSSSSRYCSSPPLKKSEKRERGRIQGLPDFLATLIIWGRGKAWLQILYAHSLRRSQQ